MWIDMVSGILHETGGISSRFAALVLLLLCTSSVPASASPLFDDDSVIEIRLSGPLGTVARHKKDVEREEYAFVLTVGNAEIPVNVRVRGKSRTSACLFPPLRLNFSPDAAAESVFAGQNKLKLVTHCKSDSHQFENNTLEEYTAYRIFNLISDAGYRVRLLRVQYADSDSKLRNLDRPYYGFLIESNSELASRIDATVARVKGVPYSRLNDGQTARLFVFQYLIGNFDWSFVTAEADDTCCHNVDLVEIDDELYPIPYDFDLAGLVNASYAKVPDELRTRRVTQRVYRGYCKIAIEEVAAALDEIVALRTDIMSVVENSPVTGGDDTAWRTRYIDRFFEQASTDRKDLLEKFDDSCVGPR
jgi:hypothetical protein